jgi:hypothetical protein
MRIAKGFRLRPSAIAALKSLQAMLQERCTDERISEGTAVSWALVRAEIELRRHTSTDPDIRALVKTIIAASNKITRIEVTRYGIGSRHVPEDVDAPGDDFDV